MSSPAEFPPQGFHIVREVDTPYGPMDMLEENVGLRLRVHLSDIVEVDSDSEYPDPPAES